MDWFWRNSSKLILVAIGSIILAMTVLFLQSMEAERHARAQALASTQIVGELRDVVRMGIEAETGQRGYLLTNDTGFLRPYDYARGRWLQDIDRIAARLEKTGTQQELWNIAQMRTLAEAKLGEQGQTIAYMRESDSAAAVRIVQSGIGRELMDDFRRLASELEEKQTERLKTVAAHAAATQQRTSGALVALLLAILVLASFSVVRDRKASRAALLDQETILLRKGKEQADLIAQELNHRVKNLFAVILSLIGLSARGSEDVPTAVDKIRARIFALSTAHSISQGKSDVQRFELKELLETILAPYRDDDSRIVIDGPEIELSSGSITPLGLIFHEVATNALKYGALSVQGGSVVVHWERDSRDLLELSWIEKGGPAPKPPKARGFGTTLVAATVEQLGGDIDNDWTEQGLILTLRFPVD